MKKFVFIISFLAVSFYVSLSVEAEVFTLWPFGKSNSGGADGPSHALGGTKLWDEPVCINGYNTSLSITLLESDLYNYISRLRSLYPDGIFSANKNALLMTVKHKDGARTRIYLLQTGTDGNYPVIQFSMKLPDKLPDRFTWPSQLPLPSGAKPLNYMNFPDKKLYYGTFSANSSAEQSVGEMKQQLLSSGWQNVSKGTFPQSSQCGDILIKNKPLSIAILSAGESEGKCKASVMVQPLK
ncbi:MAG: hypothetical protein A2017_06230 [Lentisphaerae bacterium GWF2_44_16]|nr:MAG: hypothetical protein A2017_06230 [Lentisphaerae bacterium GWF2_44_16]